MSSKMFFSGEKKLSFKFLMETFQDLYPYS